MPQRYDLRGRRFGRLLAIEPTKRPPARQTYWRCRCDCGAETVVRQAYLLRDVTKSCGCYSLAVKQTHGESHTSLYGRWRSFRQRCNNPRNKRYADYGGRGIKCAREWDDFAAFSEWAHANGYRSGLQIDRIDNDGPYAPWNCRWVDAVTNMRNRRRTPKIIIRGEELALSEAAERFGIAKTTLVGRLARGVSPEDAVSVPPRCLHPSAFSR